MQPFQVLIDNLEKGRDLHITVSDFSGILSTPLTKIRFDHMIHSKKFCDTAKSTPRGYHACLRCKAIANARAIAKKTPFCGQCIYGMYEAAVPVVIEHTVMGIVYVGNAIIDKSLVKERIKKICTHTGASAEALISELDACEQVNSAEELFEVGEIAADYLKMLYESAPVLNTEKHWIVSLMKRYAKEHTQGTVSLQEFAVSHKKNAQYIGRLFKNEVGMSFGSYCNTVRLEKAALALIGGNQKIIDVALGCGFSNISHFNRLFKEKYGVSPMEYKIRNTVG